MRIKLLLLGLLFSLGIQAQQLDPQRTGKDSIAIETSMVRMTEKFTTAEINAFTRIGANNPAYVFNSDTETLWAWTGTEWKDLGLAPIAGGITIDPTIQNGSTNPVENNAVYDRLIRVVDEAPDSPHNDIEWWYGTMDQYRDADKTNPRRFFLVSDSIYDPGPDGDGDGYIENMFISGNQLNVVGQGGAFNGSLVLPGGGSNTDDQIFTEAQITLDNLFLSIENGNQVQVDLSRYFQLAADVPFNDFNLNFANANDVQEVLDESWSYGSELVTNVTAAADVQTCFAVNTFTSSIDVGLKSSITTVYWSKSGPNIHFSCVVEIEDFDLLKNPQNTGCNQGVALSVNIPNPLPDLPSRPEAVDVSFIPFWNNGNPTTNQFASYMVSDRGWASGNTIKALVNIEFTGDPGEAASSSWTDNKLIISGTYRIN